MKNVMKGCIVSVTLALIARVWIDVLDAVIAHFDWRRPLTTTHGTRLLDVDAPHTSNLLAMPHITQADTMITH